MSKYTTQVRFICETAAGYDESQGFKYVDEIIAKAIPKIFDFPFHIYDEKYKPILCAKILRHYYTREICCETVGRWKLFLEDKLNTIMPYYNKLYESEAMKYDPFEDVNTTNKTTDILEADMHHDVDVTRTDDLTATRTDDLTSTRTDNLHKASSSREVNRYSDTPQGGIDGLLGTGATVEGNTFLTNARIVDLNGSTDNTGTQTGKNTGTQTTTDTGTVKNKGDNNHEHGTNTRTITTEHKGKLGNKSYSELVLEHRKTFLNIDRMIINDCSDLFMNIW